MATTEFSKFAGILSATLSQHHLLGFETRKAKEKRRYTHLNVEFQRIARRVKKGFLSDQCKEIEENNRMEKTRDHFKKTGNIKGLFHARMGMIEAEMVRT